MKEITAAELKRLRETGIPHQLIDVREPYEAEACSIGGTLIPLGEIVDRIAEIRRDVLVICHCRSGSRGAAAVQALGTRYGFTNIANLQGGIAAYAAEVEPALNCDR